MRPTSECGTGSVFLESWSTASDNACLGVLEYSFRQCISEALLKDSKKTDPARHSLVDLRLLSTAPVNSCDFDTIIYKQQDLLLTYSVRHFECPR